MTKERPILFSGPMVRAILEGRKTQTRRIAKEFDGKPDLDRLLARHPRQKGCRYGEPGDRLWVREAWCHFPADAPDGMGEQVYYRADPGSEDFRAKQVMGRNGIKWRSAIYMPRSLSRITLEITDVRVQRLQEISEEDARLEGVQPGLNPDGEGESYVAGFGDLWESIHGPSSWNANPWVWAITFGRVEQGVSIAP